MNYLDIYYRALVDYRKNTIDNHDCKNQRGTTAKANAKSDEVIITRQLCDIETDWIEAIEEGLVHVDKAIREDRQFIRSNGEIIDIEKVKNVSKDSVEHLARHSNLITRYKEGEDIIPDRLYTVERLSDYAVYENKFLYMLLCYLRDFITMRYNNILDLEHTYSGKMAMSKKVVMPKRKINFNISLDEECKDDPYLKKQSKSSAIIQRIRNILELTHAFLATPLMQEVSKVPMLKPPITKTNVLRMNHNFRGALALYEYISAYDKDGYTVHEEVQRISPFKLDMSDEFSEIVLLSSFLTYEYGLGIKDELRAEYDKEEERRKAEEIKRHLEQIKAMKRRIKESGESPDEYMLALEKINKSLEQNTEKLVIATKEIEELNGVVADLKAQTNMLNSQVTSLKSNIETLKEEHELELERLDREHREAIQGLTDEYEAKIDQLNEEHSANLKRICDECDAKVDEIKQRIEEERINHDNAIVALKEAHREAIEELNDDHRQKVNDLNIKWQSESDRLNTICRSHIGKIEELEGEKVKIEESRRLAEARLIAIRKEHGMDSSVDDFTTEAAFEELEHQLDVFERFFNEEWKKAKKAIRKNSIREFFESLKLAKQRRSSPEGIADKRAKLDENVQIKDQKNNKKNNDGKVSLQKKQEEKVNLQKSKEEKVNLQKTDKDLNDEGTNADEK